jgi:predicted TIM-barrel fold metal-dependent hydrolase
VRALPALLLVWPLLLSAQPPVADMHLHYKWSQRDVTTPADAIEILDTQNIVLGVVIGTPAELALELQQLAPQRIVAIYGPYRIGGDWQRWIHDEGVIERTRTALETGRYHGIGELHLIGGFAPKLDTSSVLAALMALAAEFDVPIMLHTEFSRPDSLLRLCGRYPETRILWAHAGAILAPQQVRQVMETCDNVWAGLAARDPWRFVDYPITSADKRLLPDWRELLLAYPERFMLGSDPVWPVEQLDAWDRDDTGWQELGRFWDYHRHWLTGLPADVARKIRCENAVRLFRRTEVTECVE